MTQAYTQATVQGGCNVTLPNGCSAWLTNPSVLVHNTSMGMPHPYTTLTTTSTPYGNQYVTAALPSPPTPSPLLTPVEAWMVPNAAPQFTMSLTKCEAMWRTRYGTVWVPAMGMPADYDTIAHRLHNANRMEMWGACTNCPHWRVID